MQTRKILSLCMILAFLLVATPAYALWLWTPETNKWVNPKNAVKDTPGEQFTYSMSYYEAKEYEKAIKEFRKLVKEYPKAREAAEAQYYLGRTFEFQEKYFAAFTEYQKVVDMYPFSERITEVVSKQFQIGNFLMEGKGQKSQFVRSILGSDIQVVEVFRQVIKNAPYGEHAPEAQYKIGLYLKEKGLYNEARDEFENTLNDYPDTDFAQLARYQIALADAERSAGAEYDQKITQVAVDEFDEFVQDFPNSELSNEAKTQISKLREKEAENNFVVAGFYEKQKNYQAARLYYNTVIDEYSDSTWAAKALEKLQSLNLSGKK